MKSSHVRGVEQSGSSNHDSEERWYSTGGNSEVSGQSLGDSEETAVVEGPTSSGGLKFLLINEKGADQNTEYLRWEKSDVTENVIWNHLSRHLGQFAF